MESDSSNFRSFRQVFAASCWASNADDATANAPVASSEDAEDESAEESAQAGDDRLKAGSLEISAARTVVEGGV